MSDKEYLYSEIFHSLQGEGTYTGQRTAWLRYFLCNLQCNGFGQKDPTNPDTYDLPFETFDVSTVDKVEDLPVWDKGCDSSYTWAKKYKHLMGSKTPSQLCDEVEKVCGPFLHPISKQTGDMCFTGGEPMMPTSQQCTVDMMKEFIDRGNLPRSVTIETNGTKPLKDEFREFWQENDLPIELFWSVSPKLWTVAGEKASRAIKPEVVQGYRWLSNKGHLKFVVGSAQREWDEMESVVELFRQHDINWPVFIMPTGATEEEQIGSAKEVAEKALERGYNISARVHVYLFGNAIGT